MRRCNSQFTYIIKLQIILMLGSLYEFIGSNNKQQLHQPKIEIESEERRYFSQQKLIRKNCLTYYTQDKSIYLQSQQSKQKKEQVKTHEMLKQALEGKVHIHRKVDKDEHWSQQKPIDKSKLKRYHKLLKAIVKTKQLEAHDNTKTHYDRSLARIASAYSKIKTEPVDVLLPPKMPDIPKFIDIQKILKLKQRRSCPVSPTKILELQKSVKWAKNHGKKIDSFYQSLGKSTQLIQKQKVGKSNYVLQVQQKQKQEEQKRRSIRKKFLKQIQKRLNKFSNLTQ